ncbi:uncharacterized protein L969DRAFT_85742 [Mixia osmundae IAM 14324]|nr:uncharacterized protein L969DRAFT_85742 [Mixia osmundae IAM 14324]KEI40555.1 hypothetical protein L969DRAFT_85742 [Mixia osmundae IAM 14324]
MLKSSLVVLALSAVAFASPAVKLCHSTTTACTLDEQRVSERGVLLAPTDAQAIANCPESSLVLGMVKLPKWVASVVPHLGLPTEPHAYDYELDGHFWTAIDVHSRAIQSVLPLPNNMVDGVKALNLTLFGLPSDKRKPVIVAIGLDFRACEAA